MIDESLAPLCAHGQNLNRYRRLLQGNLSDLERDYVQSPISEEEGVLSPSYRQLWVSLFR